MKRVSFSEMKILEVLWSENKAMSITEINEILNRNGIQWAYICDEVYQGDLYDEQTNKVCHH